MLTNFKNSYLKQISEANRNPPEIAQSLKDLWQSELNLVEQLSSMDLDELLLDKNHSKFVDSLKELTAFCRKEAVVSTTWFNFCNKLLFEKIFCFWFWLIDWLIIFFLQFLFLEHGVGGQTGTSGEARAHVVGNSKEKKNGTRSQTTHSIVSNFRFKKKNI